MKKNYQKSLFIFRRDLRLTDNIGLRQAILQSETVIPCFIFDPVQIGPRNAYRSDNSVQYMLESLADLDAQIHAKNGRLHSFHGNTITVLSRIIKSVKPDAIFINHDYTPFSIKRDTAIAALCKKNKIAFHGFHDALLIGDPTLLLNTSKKPYGIFTAFYKKAVHIKAEEPHAVPSPTWYKNTIPSSLSLATYIKKIMLRQNPKLKVHGGRNNSLRILQKLVHYRDYAKERDFPAQDATTHLSAAHKFGTISIRESYHAIKKTLGAHAPLLRQLYWRDFFTYVAFHNPHVFGHAYHEKYNKLPWNNSKKFFVAWCKGKTGFPIVDAGMRELNTTGYMHNRVRMIAASLLIKDLHIDWRWGEKYFAQQLVDYDPSVNNGNWQWCASTGCDAQPYFRIFNPWLQQKKFDPLCAYIKQWIPELKKIDPRIIHTWFKETHTAIPGYVRPLVDHGVESKKTLQWYKI